MTDYGEYTKGLTQDQIAHMEFMSKLKRSCTKPLFEREMEIFEQLNAYNQEINSGEGIKKAFHLSCDYGLLTEYLRGKGVEAYGADNRNKCVTQYGKRTSSHLIYANNRTIPQIIADEKIGDEKFGLIYVTNMFSPHSTLETLRGGKNWYLTPEQMLCGQKNLHQARVENILNDAKEALVQGGFLVAINEAGYEAQFDERLAESNGFKVLRDPRKNPDLETILQKI